MPRPCRYAGRRAQARRRANGVAAAPGQPAAGIAVWGRVRCGGRGQDAIRSYNGDQHWSFENLHRYCAETITPAERAHLFQYTVCAPARASPKRRRPVALVAPTQADVTPRRTHGATPALCAALARPGPFPKPLLVPATAGFWPGAVHGPAGAAPANALSAPDPAADVGRRAIGNVYPRAGMSRARVRPCGAH